MRLITRPDKHGDAFEELINNHEINFVPIDEKFDDFTEMVLTYRTQHNLNLLMGDVGVITKEGIPPSRCFRVLNVKGLYYITVMPYRGQYMLVRDPGHHNAYHPDEGMAVLFAHSHPELDIKVIRYEDGSSTIKVDNVVVHDSRTTEDRERDAKIREKEIENDLEIR